MSTSKAPQTQPIETPPPATADGVVIRPALEVISRLQRGRLMDQLSIELNRVVAGVKNCLDPKAGTVTLTLKIAPVKNFDNAVQITAKVDGKAPEDPPSTDLLFYDDDANLHTRNPRQKDIFDEGPQAI